MVMSVWEIITTEKQIKAKARNISQSEEKVACQLTIYHHPHKPIKNTHTNLKDLTAATFVSLQLCMCPNHQKLLSGLFCYIHALQRLAKGKR